MTTGRLLAGRKKKGDEARRLIPLTYSLGLECYCAVKCARRLFFQHSSVASVQTGLSFP